MTHDLAAITDDVPADSFELDASRALAAAERNRLS